MARVQGAWPRGRRLPAEVWRQRHRLLTGVLWACIASLEPWILIEKGPVVAVASSVALLIPAVLASWARLPRFARTIATSFGLLTCAAQLMYVSGVFPESSYSFFVVIGLLALYQDWRSVLLGTGFAFLLLTVLGVVMPEAVSGPELTRPPLASAAMFVGFLVAASAVNLIAWRVADEAREAHAHALGATDGVYGVDTEGRIRFANPAAMRLMGYADPKRAAAQVVGADSHEVFGHANSEGRLYLPDECPICMVVLVAAGDYCTGLRFRRRDGTHFAVEYVSSPLPEGGAPGAVVTFRDITSREAEQERLERIALLDPVTGLPNRLLFRDRLESALVRMQRLPRPLAIFWLDLDRFKAVNDAFGHAAGDELLSEVARRFEAAVRATDTVSRFGGDEFAILCEHLADEADVALVAGHLLAALEEPFELEGAGTAVPVRASIGASLTLDAELTAEDLLARADAAMYRAKARGRGQWQLFDPTLARPLRRMSVDWREADEPRHGGGNAGGRNAGGRNSPTP